MPLRVALAGLLLIVLSHPASGQEVLTLDRAVHDALAHNRGLAAARAGTDEADAQVALTRSRYFPRASFVESWQRGDQPVFVFSSLLSARRFGAPNFAIDALNQPNPIGFFHGAVAIEQMVFDGGRTRADVSSAASGRVMAQATLDEAAAALVLHVTQTYGRLLIAESGLRTAAASIAAAEEDIARARRRRDAGTVTEADVLSLAVHLADVRQRAIQTTGDAAILRAELNRLMGTPVDGEFAVQEPPAVNDTAPASWSQLVAEAEAARPELRRTAAAVSLADAGRRQARAAWMPQLAAQAGYQLDGTSFADRASAWVVGGEVRWSLSMGGAEIASARASAAALARARAEHDDARAAVQVELLTAQRRLESAQARQAVAATAVDQARESQRIIRDRYDAGMAPVQDVLRASTAVLDAEAQRMAAIVERVEANAELRRALGRNP
jgi:outer membrane protein TolC